MCSTYCGFSDFLHYENHSSIKFTLPLCIYWQNYPYLFTCQSPDIDEKPPLAKEKWRNKVARPCHPKKAACYSLFLLHKMPDIIGS